MNGKAFFFIVLFLFYVPLSFVRASVVINEVSPASDPEWIELYSTDSSSVSLDGCKLQMGSVSQSVSFSSSDVLTDQVRFKVIKKGVYPGWSSNWLNNSGDTINFMCPSNNDSIAYGNASGAIIGIPTSSQTIGRSPDGNSNFTILATVTEGSANPTPTPTPTPTLTPTPSPTDSPTPTSTPTKTPTPTKSPTPTNTSTPTNTPIPSPTKTPTLTPSPSPTRESIPSGEVLSSSDSARPTASASSGEKRSSGVQPIIISLSFIGIGLGLLSLLFVWQKRNALRPPPSP